jgi:hypothetical protein
MAGNYGGNSTPTTPIDGATLLAANGTTYKNWKCNSVYSVGTSAAFTYEGEAFTLPVIGDRLELVITPASLTAAHAHAMFLCYECGCGSPMTGTTAASSYYSGMTGMNRPTIIGGGGLNS